MHVGSRMWSNVGIDQGARNVVCEGKHSNLKRSEYQLAPKGVDIHDAHLFKRKTKHRFVTFTRKGNRAPGANSASRGQVLTGVSRANDGWGGVVSLYERFCLSLSNHIRIIRRR